MGKSSAFGAGFLPKTVQCSGFVRYSEGCTNLFPKRGHLILRRRTSAVVHGHGEPDVEVLVEHLAAEGHPLAEHVHRHQTERLAVHQEPFRVHRGKVVGAHQAADPPLHVLAEPGSWI